MDSSKHRLARRRFLQAMAGGVAAGPASVRAAVETPVDLPAAHRKAVNRRRRIVVQYDPCDVHGIDFEEWINFRGSSRILVGNFGRQEVEFSAVEEDSGAVVFEGSESSCL